MNLRHKIEYDFFGEVKNNYCINCSNIAFYMYWNNNSPVGIYKDELLGLDFWPASREVTNYPSGIKIEYRR